MNLVFVFEFSSYARLNPSLLFISEVNSIRAQGMGLSGQLLEDFFRIFSAL